VNFLADESIDKPIVDALRLSGYIVEYVAELSPSISDNIIFEMANKNNALLLTADKDFGELVFRLLRLSSGVILIRLAGLSQKKKTEIIVHTISKHASELREAFSVITHTGIRIRRINFNK